MTIMPWMSRWALPLACVSTLVVCSPQTAPVPTYPGELQHPSRFSTDFLLLQQLIFRRGEQEHSSRMALQHRGDTLTLVGLTPMGTRAFALRQLGLEVTYNSYLPEDQELPFPPRYILYDVQRTLLPVLDRRSLEDGEHSRNLGDEVVVERWQDSRLIERRYRRRSGDPEGDLIITYGDDGYVFGEAPGSLEINNEWLGYQLSLTTLSFQQL